MARRVYDLSLTLCARVSGMPAIFGAAVGFINAPLAVAAREMQAWYDGLALGDRFFRHDGGLVENAPRLLPLTIRVPTRKLLVQTQAREWTALFDSQYQGGEVLSPLSVVSSRLGVVGIMVTSHPFVGELPATGSIPGGVQLFYEDYRYSPEIGRYLSVIEGEGSSHRYTVSISGAEQPWEEPEHYTARFKRDRFNEVLLDRYARRLGLRPFDLDFYAGPSVLVERPDPVGIDNIANLPIID